MTKSSQSEAPNESLVLTARQQTAIQDATASLPPLQRHALIASLKIWLRNRTDIGDGELFRVLRELQREQLLAPAEDGQ
jgi:hypothetical protein